MVEIVISGVKINVPQEQDYEELYSSRLASFLNNPDNVSFLKEQFDNADYDEGVIYAVIGESFVLGQTDLSLARNLNFELFNFQNSMQLASALHSYMVVQERENESVRLRLISNLSNQQLEERIADFVKLPVIELSDLECKLSFNEEGVCNIESKKLLFFENVYRCPVINRLSRTPSQIKTIYFLAPSPDSDSQTVVERSEYSIPHFLYETTIEDISIEDAFLKYNEIVKDRSDMLVIKVPTYACLMDACASTRQELIYEITPEQKTKLASRVVD
nr:hypothetical protein [Nanoarchaeum sp.]